MMFLDSLTSWLRKRTPAVKTPKSPSTRLRLEQLEDRIVPAFTTGTYVNPTVQITPGFTVTETVTATVTTFPSISMNGQIIPVPAGAFNPTSGNVLFILNNQVKSAPLNANGQASATFQVPILAFFASQQLLDVFYNGSADPANQNFWEGNTFRAPLYTNFVNLLLPGNLTFGQLTPQQVSTMSLGTTNGETNNLGLFAFNYVDPGQISSVTAFGVQFSGSVALQLGAFNGLTSSSSSSSG
jgi:hypothetical protein